MATASATAKRAASAFSPTDHASPATWSTLRLRTRYTATRSGIARPQIRAAGSLRSTKCGSPRSTNQASISSSAEVGGGAATSAHGTPPRPGRIDHGSVASVGLFVHLVASVAVGGSYVRYGPHPRHRRDRRRRSRSSPCRRARRRRPAGSVLVRAAGRGGRGAGADHPLGHRRHRRGAGGRFVPAGRRPGRHRPRQRRHASGHRSRGDGDQRPAVQHRVGRRAHDGVAAGAGPQRAPGPRRARSPGVGSAASGKGSNSPTRHSASPDWAASASWSPTGLGPSACD